MSTPVDRRIRILLVEEESLVRAALQKLLESWPECEVVGDAGSTSEALTMLGRLEADLVMLTLPANESQNLEIVSQLAETSEQLLVLVGEGLPVVAADIVRHGARGVVRKNKAPDELRRAIQKVHEGKEIWLDRASLSALVNVGRPRAESQAPSLSVLTRRECEVAGLVSKGLKNKEVGEQLFISETTVRHHLTTIFSKLEVRNRFELIDHMHRHKPFLSKERTSSPSGQPKGFRREKR
jgi:DNA-binding NarL/FixJ family response regulator